MKAYVGYSKEAGSREGAVLVFAHNSREALQLARPILQSWFQVDFTDSRVRLLKDSQYLFNTEANKEKLSLDIAHVIESPTTCRNCELWGKPLDGNERCEDCADELSEGVEPQKVAKET